MYKVQDIGDEFEIVDKDDKTVAYSSDKEYADMLCNALNEYVSSKGIPTGNNRGIPRKTTILRAIEESIRRTRQNYLDRALDGVSVYAQCGPCNVHNVGNCPPYIEQIPNVGTKEWNNDNACQFDINGLILNLPDGSNYKLEISRETE